MSCFLHHESSCLTLRQLGCCLLTPQDLEYPLANLPLVVLIAQRELNVLGFPGTHTLNFEHVEVVP